MVPIKPPSTSSLASAVFPHPVGGPEIDGEEVNVSVSHKDSLQAIIDVMKFYGFDPVLFTNLLTRDHYKKSVNNKMKMRLLNLQKGMIYFRRKELFISIVRGALIMCPIEIHFHAQLLQLCNTTRKKVKKRTVQCAVFWQSILTVVSAQQIILSAQIIKWT